MSIDIGEKDTDGRLKLIDEKLFPKLLSTQQAIASSVFSTTVRVSEGNLRKEQTDKMQALLAALKEEEEGQEPIAPDTPKSDFNLMEDAFESQDEKPAIEDSKYSESSNDTAHELTLEDLL